LAAEVARTYSEPTVTVTEPVACGALGAAGPVLPTAVVYRVAIHRLTPL
jgi:hypothetical protein